MPLHDWSEQPGWEGVCHVWLVELLYWIKPRLPEGYRAYIAAPPVFTIGSPFKDAISVSVESTPDETGEDLAWTGSVEVSLATLPVDTALLVERHGRLVAAIELVSPRNKDRLDARQNYAGIYAGYLRKRVNLLLVDVHPNPLRFSFADRIARDLVFDQPPTLTPFATTYRVGEPSPNGGHFFAWMRQPLRVGEPLPTLPLALTVHQSVMVDLEQTYARAAEAAYLPFFTRHSGSGESKP